MKLPETPNRRTVLKTLGAGAVGSALLVGNSAGGPRTNFAYVPDKHTSDTDDDGSEDTVDGAKATLVTHVGREKLNCNDAGANIKTTVFKVNVVNAGSETWYFIPNSYREGETVKITSNAADCRSDNWAMLTEVGVTKV